MSGPKIVIIGGGAAGIFTAINAAAAHPHAKVIVLEKTQQLLTKVKISGGGRCNVTHACFEPRELIRFYPRGGEELLGPFHRFQPRDMMEWLEARDVTLKIEEDGRVFPRSNSSQTIIDCLLKEAQKCGVDIQKGQKLLSITKEEKGSFTLSLASGEKIDCDSLVLASGSSPQGYAFAQSLGHTIMKPVFSLFSFHIQNFSLADLAGISVNPVKVKIAQTNLTQDGPILITHLGFSGPAILKLSAWGARVLFEKNYEADLVIDWLTAPAYEDLLLLKQKNPSRTLWQENPFHLPKQLWKRFLERSLVSSQRPLAEISLRELDQLSRQLSEDTYRICGKSPNKEEFVTCGGVSLKEVSFKTMESRLCPGLFFAGEILDIDGVTGGFNFQNAWTTGWIAGNSATSA